MIPDDEPFVFYDPKAPENQPPPPTPGLVEALEILKDIEGIGVVELNRKDIVRHKLVTRIVNAYERFDKGALPAGGEAFSES